MESVACSRRSPSPAPQGAHLSASGEKQSHGDVAGLLLAGQSVVFGTATPVWGTPMSWNSSSVSCGPVWQSMHDPLPTNSRAPFCAFFAIATEVGPAETNLSKSDGPLTSLYS